MAKDPAVLFYTSDFLSGTSFFTDEQTGIYIRLLCQQHQLGEIPKPFFSQKVLGHDIIRQKFTETETGFYQERMRTEAEKRKKFCASRRCSVAKRYDKSTYVDTYVAHTHVRMEDENENRNKDINESEIKKEIVKRKQEPKETITIPENLNTSSFRAIWNDWVSYRKEIRKPMAVKTSIALLNRLSATGAEIGMAMLRQSIENGWQGVFDIKDNFNEKGKNGNNSIRPRFEFELGIADKYRDM